MVDNIKLYLYYKSHLIFNLKYLSRYLRLKFICVNPTNEISFEFIFFPPQTITSFFSKDVGPTPKKIKTSISFTLNFSKLVKKFQNHCSF